MRTVNCLGIAVMDALSGPIDAYPEPRVRTQVNTRTIRFQPGGGAVNSASALARMGYAAAVFSKVGADPLGSILMEELRRAGADPSGIAVSQQDTTPFTFVGVHGSGDRTFIHTPGANLTMTMADVDRERLLAADVLLYQDLFVVPGLEADAPDLLTEARRRGMITVLDECWGLGPDRERFERLLPCCDYVVPSQDDMAAIYPGWRAQAVAAHILACGAGAVVVKMGAGGCLVNAAGCVTPVPALPAAVVDTTGAGDCWDAGFIAGLLEGADPVEAARLGCACAAFCIEAVGGAAGVPAFAEVRRAGEREAMRPGAEGARP